MRHLLKSHNEGTWLTCDICEKKLSTNAEFRSIYVDMKVQRLIVMTMFVVVSLRRYLCAVDQ